MSYVLADKIVAKICTGTHTHKHIIILICKLKEFSTSRGKCTMLVP